jgi:hypothetical protein
MAPSYDWVVRLTYSNKVSPRKKEITHIDLNPDEKRSKSKLVKFLDRKIARFRLENLVDEILLIEMNINDFTELNMISIGDKLMFHLSGDKDFKEKFSISGIRYKNKLDYELTIKRSDVDKLLGYCTTSCDFCCGIYA